jgi:hypothetical protein
MILRDDDAWLGMIIAYAIQKELCRMLSRNLSDLL